MLTILIPLVLQVIVGMVIAALLASILLRVKIVSTRRQVLSCYAAIGSLGAFVISYIFIGEFGWLWAFGMMGHFAALSLVMNIFPHVASSRIQVYSAASYIFVGACIRWSLM